MVEKIDNCQALGTTIINSPNLIMNFFVQQLIYRTPNLV